MKRRGELIKLAYGLRSVPRERFNLQTWESSCGTTACAIGWFPKLVPECKLQLVAAGAVIEELPWWGNRYAGESFKIVPSYKRLGGRRRVEFDAVASYFGISKETAKYLFSKSEYPEDKNGPRDVSDRLMAVLGIA